MGYGVQAGYQVTSRWSAVVGFDLYRFDVSANLDELIEGGSAILEFLNLPDALSVDMNSQTWNVGFRYSIPYRSIVPFVGFVASTNRLTVEGFGISISRRYWGLAPIVGAEWRLSNRWGVQADARLQTIFIDDIPFVQEVVKEHLVFIPLQLGVVYHIGQ
ncbi:MAG: outer membrane beta-barrel protein [Bacteroidota bacterium]